jgi:hypothetical protein
MASLATALADWLSMAAAGEVIAPARFALFGQVVFIYQSGGAAAKEGPESLGRFQKGHK